MHVLETPEYRLATPCEGNVFQVGRYKRVTFITDRLIRFEYDPDGKFEDRQTLAVLNRDLGPVKVKASGDLDCMTLESKSVKIRIQSDNRPFARRNLNATFKVNGETAEWYPEKTDRHNLKGTMRTLDRCRGQRVFHRAIKGDRTSEMIWEDLKIPDGFLSRSGWSVYDDSKSVVITRKGGRKWIEPRPDNQFEDLYLFAYGHDYKTCLGDVAGVFGSQPLAPRFTLGYWYCRYWAHTDREFEEIIDEMDNAKTPIDVIVVDMDWHKEGWTGYTWDRRYFPNPDDFLREMHRRGCKVALNLHPAEGVGKQEDQFPAMCKAMGLDPETTDRVPFAITDPKYMKHYFEILHHPEEKRGVDFWWMDWQQGTTTPMRNLDTLPWLNHLHWEDMQKRHVRPLIFSRYGGVGAGKYVIGFSGDLFSDWESLDFEVYFTICASNALYGTWSHDIGGHNPGIIDAELYLRWMQYAVYNPIVRTHTTKHFLAERRFSKFENPYRDYMLRSIRERYELVPYIYSENRHAFDTGVSITRPLYYEYPEVDRAYSEKNTYFFGPQLLVKPIVKPMDKETRLCKESVWLPPGEWFDVYHGRLLKGDKSYAFNYMLDEMPLFAKAGAIIPGMQDVKRLAKGSYPNLTVTVYPGAEGSYDLYEDDGETPDYAEEGNYAYIRMSHRKTGLTRKVTVKHLSGNFKGFLKNRPLEFRLFGVIPPEKVTFNNKKVDFTYRFSDDKAAQWRYDGMTSCIIVRLTEADLEAGATLAVTYDREDEFTEVAGVRGMFRRLKEIAVIGNAFTQVHYTINIDERLPQELAHAAVRMSMTPGIWKEELLNIKHKIKNIYGVLETRAKTMKPRWGASDTINWVWTELKIAEALLEKIRQ